MSELIRIGEKATLDAALLKASFDSVPAVTRFAPSVSATCLTREPTGAVVPLAGKWKAVETARKAQCVYPVKPRKSDAMVGTIKVSENGDQLGAAGFMGGEGGKVALSRNPEKNPSYRGTTTMKEGGAKAKVTLVWDAMNEKKMTGTTTARFQVQGKPCRIVRKFKMDFVRP